MITKWKLRLRAWLIDLVREAIRTEMIDQSQIFPAKGGIAVYDPGPAWPQKVASKPVTSTSTVGPEKTFEQFQAESIAEQEKFYEPQLRSE